MEMQKSVLILIHLLNIRLIGVLVLIHILNCALLRCSFLTTCLALKAFHKGLTGLCQGVVQL
jgi:hypothetical protein